ncbi:MAG: c-type cytochrome [Chloroflexi bacterium]|nr:c-type cytochrome [Chloroflexota bacterium]
MPARLSRPALAVGLAALGLAFALLAAVGWALAQRPAASMGIPAPTPTASDAPAVGYATLRERGLLLFVAKGCTTCHQQQEAANRGYPASVRFGPDLTDLPQRFPAHPGAVDYLRSWLKDPSAIRPGTAMPTLGLSDEEIDALLHFLLTEAHFAS